MLERPFEFIARLAQRVQETAGRISDAAYQKADAINARAAERVRARVMRARERNHRPSIRFVRELRHGQTSLSFYQRIDRAGNVREFWTLTRENHRGRETLATGSLDVFKDIRSIVQQTLPQARERQESVKPEPSRTTQVEAKTLWHALYRIERINPDGTAQARVVRSVNDLDQAQEHLKRHPDLSLDPRGCREPLKQGAVITVAVAERELREFAEPYAGCRSEAGAGDFPRNGTQAASPGESPDEHAAIESDASPIALTVNEPSKHGG